MKNRIIALFAIVVSLTAITMYTFTVLKRNAQGQQEQPERVTELPQIANKTSSLQVISYKVIDNEAHFLLKNVSKKDINAFYVTILSNGDGTTYQVELLYSDIKTEISPDQDFTFRAPLEEISRYKNFTLHAVLFADGTSDGEQSYVQEIIEVREGEKIQLIKGLRWIKEITSLPNIESTSEFTNLNQKLSSLYITDKTESQAFNSGLSSGKETLTNYLQKIQTAQDLLKLQSKLESIISRLQNGAKRGRK
jgi:hypothetical protein